MKDLFSELLFRKSIDVTGISDIDIEKIFIRSRRDPKNVTIPDLMWVAEEISNTLPTVEGVEFLRACVTIASAELNRS